LHPQNNLIKTEFQLCFWPPQLSSGWMPLRRRTDATTARCCPPHSSSPPMLLLLLRVFLCAAGDVTFLLLSLLVVLFLILCLALSLDRKQLLETSSDHDAQSALITI
jgi:hypothetical protein